VTATLAAVAGSGAESVRPVLEDARERGLLVAEHDYQFAHPLLRQALYDRPSVTERRRPHARLAAGLYALPPDPRPDQTLEIAHHMLAAGDLVEAAARVELARRAGDVAFARAAWTDAARFYEAALAAPCPLSTAARAELHRLAGLSHYRDQDAGPCLDQYERAIAAFREVDDARGLARALMGRTRAEFTLASVSYGTLLDTAPLVEVAERLATEDPVLAGFVWA